MHYKRQNNDRASGDKGPSRDINAALMLLMRLEDADLALLRNAVRIADNYWSFELPKDIQQELFSTLVLLIQPDEIGMSLLKDVLVFIRHICQDPGLDKLVYDLPQDTTGKLLAALARKIQQDDTDLLLDSLTVFSLLARTNEGRQAVIDAGIVPYLIQFLGHDDTGLKIVAVRVLGQITAGHR